MTAPHNPGSGSSKRGGGRGRRTPREPRVGDVIGAYMLVDELAAGGMGRVFRAVDREGNAHALKTILKNEGIYRKRFEREVQVGMVLDHEHLVKLVDCDMNHPWPYLVQELLMGVNLRDLYKARRRLPERAVMFIVLQISRALNAAVRFQIIHRDIKPDNIFMTTTGACKLLDMGLVKVGGMERVTDVQDLVGTLQFMAPEQLRDASSVDHHADVYSLGATAFLLLTGRLPRRGGNVREVTQAMLSTPKVSPRKVFGKVSKEADAIISRMTMVNPLERYETPAHLVEELERYFRRRGLDPQTLPSSFLLQELIPESMEPESSSEEQTAPSASDVYAPLPRAEPQPQPPQTPPAATASSTSSAEWATGSAAYAQAQAAERMHEARGDVSEVYHLPLTPEPVNGPETGTDQPEETPPHAVPVAGEPPPQRIPTPPPPPQSTRHPAGWLDSDPQASASGSQDPLPVLPAHSASRPSAVPKQTTEHHEKQDEETSTSRKRQRDRRG